MTNFQSLGGPLKGPPKRPFWIEFRAILGPGPPLGGLEARNHVFLRVFSPWGPESTCFYVFVAPGGPKPCVLHVFGLLDVENTIQNGRNRVSRAHVIALEVRKSHSEWVKPGIGHHSLPCFKSENLIQNGLSRVSEAHLVVS